MKKRLAVKINGLVQGVGFRPFIYRLAIELNLCGFVMNNTEGVYIEVEGEEEKLREFLIKIEREKPKLARIDNIEFSLLEALDYKSFEIRESSKEGKIGAFLLPDVSVCDDCLKEILDPLDRRYKYPFTTCTNCGPRFTIAEAFPFDRENTTMKDFVMCSECSKEYKDPSNRRFHAQSIACSICGPWLSLYSSSGDLVAEKEEALSLSVEFLKEGKILAIKGIGGFHLVCDATREDVVKLLRERKRRKEKPFAVMFKNLDELMNYAYITEVERNLLISPQRPIVLVKSKDKLAYSVAPKLKRIGAFLPYSPLHYLLLNSLSFPVVATSGNLTGEPIVKDDEEALIKLSKIADFILIHNRHIRRRCDDSVVKVIGGIPTPIRRSRGYVPEPIKTPFRLNKKVLAVGGRLKNTFSIALENMVIVSQHVGDIENKESLETFEEMVFDFMKLYDFEPDIIVCDLHPRYETTQWAKSFSEERGIPLISLQHHYAHILSCMVENLIEGKVLGIAWDGLGYGEDGTLWGGEFLEVTYTDYKRLFHFKPFKLIGGERAIVEPARIALSLLFEVFGENALSFNLPSVRFYGERDIKNLFLAWIKGINSPLSTSAGRLFDAVASLLNISHRISHEGQASMMLEDLYRDDVKDYYPFEIKGKEIDWSPMLVALIEDKEKDKVPSRFINTLAHICLEVAKKVGLEKVCLSGGVMQNAPLVSKIIELLEREKFKVYVHRKVPPNDGGLSLGQAIYGGLFP